MARNTAPIFTATPIITTGVLTGNIASSRSDGVGTIGTDMIKVFEGKAVDGSRLNKIVISPVATTPTTMATSIIRLFISSLNSGTTSAADTHLIKELIAFGSAAANASTPIDSFVVPIDIAIPAGYTILASIHHNLTANTSWKIVAMGGDLS